VGRVETISNLLDILNLIIAERHMSRVVLVQGRHTGRSVS
jgi:hypothetical protein